MIGRSHLREVSSRWAGRVVDGKTDISPEDARVIDMLLDYLVDREDYELVELLTHWKKIPDSSFIEKVKAFTNYDNIEHRTEEDNKEERESKFEVLQYIDLWDNIMPLGYIHMISMGQNWSKEREREVFYVEINPKDKVGQYKVTLRREFVKEETRDEEYQKLKTKLADSGIKFI